MRIGSGTEIEGFLLEELIGEGGMGVVYRARQLDLDRSVALKLIQSELRDDIEFKARFERESKLAASLDHPNIVPIYQAGASADLYFIAMRFVNGVDLGKHLRDADQPLDHNEACQIIAQVAAGLDAAHGAGLVHRDVKPANILLDTHHHPYLTDFGLTKQVTSQSLNTKTGVWLGSVHYSAPEQIEGGVVDARTDVYALGCVLFEALTKQLPYQRDSDIALMYAKVHQEPRKVTELDPSLPSQFDSVFARALAHDPDQRYSSAGELAADAFAASEGREPAAQVKRPAVLAPTQKMNNGATTRPARPYEDRTKVMGKSRKQQRRDEPDRHSRLPLILLGVIATLAIGALAAVALLSTRKQGTTLSPSLQTSNSRQVTKAASASGQGSQEREQTSRPPEQPEAQPQASSSDYQTPTAILEPFAGNLYMAEVPAGWITESNEEEISGRYSSQWRNESDSNTSVLIDSQPHPDSTTAMQDAETVRAATSQSSGYREVAFEPTILNGVPAARWVFDVEDDRRVDYFVVMCGVGFAVLGSTSPSSFSAWAPTFHAVAQSVEPLYCD